MFLVGIAMAKKETQAEEPSDDVVPVTGERAKASGDLAKLDDGSTMESEMDQGRAVAALERLSGVSAAERAEKEKRAAELAAVKLVDADVELVVRGWLLRILGLHVTESSRCLNLNCLGIRRSWY